VEVTAMQITGFTLNITSELPERMVAFYRDVLKLPADPAFEQFGGGGFLAGGTSIVIDAHSETLGPAQQPSRFLLDFIVPDLAAEKARLEAAGVTFVREPGREFWGGLVATFLDPDGNYLQLFELPQASNG
jgi:predicted enzyme related to lactoylglutathione lyase